MYERRYPLEPSIESFGRKLLASGDLDPLYIALHGANLGRDHLRRWLFTYWCCYHAGTACYISEKWGDHYWDMMRAMAANATLSPVGGRWPRGHERRHFRGDAAINAVDFYAKQWSQPESICAWFEDETTGTSFSGLRQKVMTLPQFGPWIAFKVGDMLERLRGVHVDFTESEVFMFSSPRDAALLVWRDSFPTPPEELVKTDNDRVSLVARDLIGQFEGYKAPPTFDRRVNIQEIETILCKWKSHLNGYYPVGLDSGEIRDGLSEWAGVSQTAGILLHHIPVYK
jgi:hypothetical protein